MTRLSTILACALVTITINQPPRVVPCPIPQPAMVTNTDGTYSRPDIVDMSLVACVSDAQSWKEEWTDYPEKDGTFIRRLP